MAELQQEEKYAFLELAVLMANIDGNVSFYEGAILNKYKKEMGLEDYQIKGLPIDDILQQFQSERSRNIVLTELFQLIYSDGVFHEKERESVRVIKEHFGFGKGEFENFKDWIEKIKDLSL